MFCPTILTIIWILVSIPQSSVQLELKSTFSTETNSQIESLIEILVRKQFRYETASYALTFHNILPNFAKYFHELAEEKYDDLKKILRLCQLLNFDVDLPDISTHNAKITLEMLSSTNFNSKNFLSFLSQSKRDECRTIVEHLEEIYLNENENSGSIQLFLKKKMFQQQKLTCKFVSDLFVRVENFVSNSNSNSIPFSLMFIDGHATILRSS